MDALGRLLGRIGDAFAVLPPWGRAAVILAAVTAMIRARMKPGAAFFTGAVVLAIAFKQDPEPFFNALNQGVTGVPTIRLFLSLGALAWMAEVLKEGGAAGRIRASRVRGIPASAMEGLLPTERPSGWFPALAPLALPVGAGFAVASELGGLAPARASALLLPLALAMAAVGLWTLSRSPAFQAADMPAGGNGDGKRGLPEVLIPVLLLLVLAFWLPETGIPAVRSIRTLPRLAEGVRGLLTPVALGSAAGGLAAAGLLGVGLPACRAAMKRAFTLDLAAFAVGLRLLVQVAQARMPYAEPHAADAAAASLRALAPGVLGSPAGLAAAALLLPGLLAFGMRGAAEGFAAALPFLLPLAGNGEGAARLAALAFAGAWLGQTLEREGRPGAVPVALTALLAGLLALAH